MRIALATVGTRGDVAPFAALASRLVAAGHEVTAITWPVHGRLLDLPGVRLELAGPHADASRIAAVAADVARRGPMEQVASLRDFHLADGAAHYRRLRELLRGHDIVMIHAIHSLAHAAALDSGALWASVTFDPVLLPTASAPPAGLPNLGTANRLLWRLLDAALDRAGRPLDAVLAQAGSGQRRVPLFRARSPRLHVLAASPAIVAVPPDLPATTHVSGAWRETGDPAALPDRLQSFLAHGAPPVVVTFGSMAGPAEPALAVALSRVLRGGRRVVVQGRTSAPASPSLLEVGDVDHRALFPHAALVVHHGGAGTTHAVVAAGVPSLVVPHVGDQRYWADRLRRLGVAAQPIRVRGMSGEVLGDRILAAAADPSLRRGAVSLAGRLAAEDGVGLTIRLLEAAAA